MTTTSRPTKLKPETAKLLSQATLVGSYLTKDTSPDEEAHRLGQELLGAVDGFLEHKRNYKQKRIETIKEETK
jgi:hypothetical protein